MTNLLYWQDTVLNCHIYSKFINFSYSFFHMVWFWCDWTVQMCLTDRVSFTPYHKIFILVLWCFCDNVDVLNFRWKRICQSKGLTILQQSYQWASQPWLSKNFHLKWSKKLEVLLYYWDGIVYLLLNRNPTTCYIG